MGKAAGDNGVKLILTERLAELLAENGNGDLLSLAIRYGGIELVT